MYMVMVLQKNIGVECMVGIFKENGSIPLSTAKGMVGMVPVFDTLENAWKYRSKQKNKGDILQIQFAES